MGRPLAVKEGPHLAGLSGDDMAPNRLCLRSIISEEGVRRALARIGAELGQDWLRRHLNQTSQTKYGDSECGRRIPPAGRILYRRI